ncbi:MAG TPA: threonine dehydratase [Rubrivivax sp.]|nr:threonine dehydratase [Rubrivivax sp.]
MTLLPDRTELEQALALVRAEMLPTPTHRWPLLEQRLGATVYVKHENHTAIGAFKMRGGIVYLHEALQREAGLRGVISATRGNHGQSIARAAARHGLTATIVVPHRNSAEKNAAMRAFGAELLEHGDDFQAALEHAAALAEARGLHLVPSFHRDLVRGVATYWLEFFGAAQPDVVFVPIGLGSGICACAAARAATGARTRIVGVVSAHATAYLDSWRAGRAVAAPASTRLADGMACRVPDEAALAIIRAEVEDIVAVDDAEVAEAMRICFTDTHNAAEGAGAAALAAALQRRTALAGRSVGVALTGGNVDRELFAQVLAGGGAAA